MVILGIRLASGAVDAVKSVGLGLGRLWRILVSQPLEPTHDVISHSDPGEAVDRAREDSDGVKPLTERHTLNKLLFSANWL